MGVILENLHIQRQPFKLCRVSFDNCPRNHSHFPITSQDILAPAFPETHRVAHHFWLAITLRITKIPLISLPPAFFFFFSPSTKSCQDFLFLGYWVSQILQNPLKFWHHINHYLHRQRFESLCNTWFTCKSMVLRWKLSYRQIIWGIKPFTGFTRFSPHARLLAAVWP